MNMFEDCFLHACVCVCVSSLGGGCYMAVAT